MQDDETTDAPAPRDAIHDPADTSNVLVPPDDDDVDEYDDVDVITRKPVKRGRRHPA